MKTVLITGASRGIGLATAKKFLAEGYKVIGTSIDGKLPLAEVIPITLELTSSDSIASAAEAVQKLGTRIDILINNAGVVLPQDRTDTDTVNPDRLRRTLEVNLIGLIDFAERVLPLVNKGGHIIQIGSRSAILSAKLEDDDLDAPAYRISKAALNMYTKLLGKRLEKKEITVSSIDPGWVRTDMGGPDAQRDPEEVGEEIFKLATSKVETGQFWKRGEKRSW